MVRPKHAVSNVSHRDGSGVDESAFNTGPSVPVAWNTFFFIESSTSRGRLFAASVCCSLAEIFHVRTTAILTNEHPGAADLFSPYPTCTEGCRIKLCSRAMYQYTVEKVTSQGCLMVTRHLEIAPVTLSAAKDLTRWTQRSFAALRMTARIPLTVLSREVFSPNVWTVTISEKTFEILPSYL